MGAMASAIPKISGVAKVGASLSAVASTWAPGAASVFKWLSNGTEIKGETKGTLKLTASLKGKQITVTVTQSAAGYASTTLTSAAVVVTG
jgi:hypothetical protein